MSPARDPETGQFVSRQDQVGWHDFDHIGGGFSVTIPAAELGGGTGGHDVWSSADASEAIDATPHLDNDEVFEAWVVQWQASLSMPTTSTAESSAGMAWALTPEGGVGPVPWSTSPTFYGGGQQDSVTNAGITSNVSKQTEVSRETIVGGFEYKGSYFADSTNGLGGGGENANSRGYMPMKALYGGGPVLDRDDELFIAMELVFDNISDHAVVGTVGVVMHGITHELD